MKEISLNILDIAENSLKAKASTVKILINETERELEIIIEDDGCGMTEETLRSVTNPFYTTRTTRKVGMGIPLFKMEAEQTGGTLTIASRHRDDFPDSHGTTVKASFFKSSIDFIPLGDITDTVVTLIHGHPSTDLIFTHNMKCGSVTLDTKEIRAVLEDVPLDSFEVLSWIRQNLEGQYEELNQTEIK